MAYNISEVGGDFSGPGLDDWTVDVDITDPSVSVVSGDFDEVPILGGGAGEAPSGYTFSNFNFGGFGTLDFNTTDGTFTFTISKGTVYNSGSDQTVSFQVSATGTYEGFGGPEVGTDVDTVYINLLICVARGTLVKTGNGLVKVENLESGEMVMTKDDGLQPVRWIGSRKLSSSELRADPSLRPIRIEKNALGELKPSRDLLVSPQHRVLISDWRSMVFFGQEEVLAPAKGLVNDTTITVDHSLEPVEYFHILFDRHQIIETDGAMTESFCPGDFALKSLHEDVRNELFDILPQLRADTESYGPAARYSVKAKESGLLSAAGETGLLAA